ncbi:formate dehydrogenase accessory sulfurtransferase FdhD, partial [Acinetobacter sp. UBA6526]|uniref:formate dehydrogenase accessory sulfurtransferase FdhD n=1 Tax=Acinetobacter sp. UBA6526 TaxID=1945950 RepID=UPI00257B77A3
MDTQTLGYETMQVHRFHRDISENELDYIVQEYPVALIYNGISHAVMMATPSDIEVFAKGFSLSEGILTNLNELYSLEISQNELGVRVDMTISSRAFTALKEHRRMMVGRTGCGLCGIESLKQLYANLPTVNTTVPSKWLGQIPDAIAPLKVR